jgi:hypothetical protein
MPPAAGTPPALRVRGPQVGRHRPACRRLVDRDVVRKANRGAASCESVFLQKPDMALMAQSVFCDGLSKLTTNLAITSVVLANLLQQDMNGLDIYEKLEAVDASDATGTCKRLGAAVRSAGRVILTS